MCHPHFMRCETCRSRILKKYTQSSRTRPFSTIVTRLSSNRLFRHAVSDKALGNATTYVFRKVSVSWFRERIVVLQSEPPQLTGEVPWCLMHSTSLQIPAARGYNKWAMAYHKGYPGHIAAISAAECLRLSSVLSDPLWQSNPQWVYPMLYLLDITGRSIRWIKQTPMTSYNGFLWEANSGRAEVNP